MVLINYQAQSTTSCGAAATPEQEFICDICMLAYKQQDMHGLECGHLFCRQCWDKYLRVMVMDEGKAQVCNNLYNNTVVCLSNSPTTKTQKMM